MKTLEAVKKPRGYAHSVALLNPKLINFLETKGKLPRSALVTIEDDHTLHLAGRHKDAVKALPKSIIKNLPLYLHKYKLALWDKGKENIILVMDKTGERQGRAAVEINFKLNRGDVTNSVRSLGVVDITSYKKSGFEVIEGTW